MATSNKFKAKPTAEISPFRFDVDFLAKPEPKEEIVKQEVAPPEPTILVSEHERQLVEAEQMGFARGLEKSTEESEMSFTEQLVLLENVIADQLSVVLEDIDTKIQFIEKQAVLSGCAVAKCLAETLISQTPMEEIEALILSHLPALRNTGHLVIRVAPDQATALQERLKPTMNRMGFSGKLIILEEDDINAGDCAIEWADGGIVRNLTDAIQNIDAAIAARFPDPAQEIEPEPTEIQSGQNAETTTSEGNTP